MSGITPDHQSREILTARAAGQQYRYGAIGSREAVLQTSRIEDYRLPQQRRITRTLVLLCFFCTQTTIDLSMVWFPGAVKTRQVNTMQYNDWVWAGIGQKYQDGFMVITGPGQDRLWLGRIAHFQTY